MRHTNYFSANIKTAVSSGGFDVTWTFSHIFPLLILPNPTLPMLERAYEGMLPWIDSAN